MKSIQINGIRINKRIRFKAKSKDMTYVFEFWPYSEYLVQKGLFINPNEIKECGTVVVYNSMADNSIEVHYIKIFISMLFFAYRINVEEIRKNNYLIDPINALFTGESILKNYQETENPLVKNWGIRGFWNCENIENIHWDIKLGQTPLSCDDFESYLSRAYGNELCDSYYRRYNYSASEKKIDVDDSLEKILDSLNVMINDDTEFGNKLKSSFRFYYELFMIYTNMNMSIITTSTIFETLLLDEDEDNQRKKVAVRSACLIFDGMGINLKTNVAESIYFFYKYRNEIVHRGKSYLDFDEVQLNHVLENMKHVIFGIIYHYYKEQPKNIEDIKEVVKNNVNADGLKQGFDYIRENADYHFVLKE